MVFCVTNLYFLYFFEPVPDNEKKSYFEDERVVYLKNADTMETTLDKDKRLVFLYRDEAERVKWNDSKRDWFIGNTR